MPTQSLTEELLEEQRDLSAVDRFALWHEGRDAALRRPQSAQRADPTGSVYRDLIPLSAPLPGQQFGFEVNLDKCSGCKACASACHSLNGLDEGESWRDVGLLVSDDWRQPYQQTITTACHHCVEPACLYGCPVLAYDKDPVTGIVRHLDDQCIGCQYCVLKCPYDVPKYSKGRGIVRKCDMCSNRLAELEAPACVQACPNEAIRITIVDQSAMSPELAETNTFLPTAPPADYTLPTTRFKTARQIPNAARSASLHDLKPQPAHVPLVVMLVLTQLSAGMFLMAALLHLGGWGLVSRTHSIIAALVCMAGLLASVLHLGRPLGAWRSFLGIRRSWLSREIVAFGVFVGCAIANLWVALPKTAAAAGLIAVFCSAMVYADTRRELWALRFSLSRFLGTTLLLGASATLIMEASLALIVVTILAAMMKLAVEHRITAHLWDDDFSPLHKTALLLTERFGFLQRLSVFALVAGGLALPSVLAVQLLSSASIPIQAQAVTLFAVCVVGEFVERWLFFTTVQPVRMPGNIST